jgi:hypothetical protein
MGKSGAGKLVGVKTCSSGTCIAPAVAGRRQKAESRRQKVESRRQKVESRRQKGESGRQKAESRWGLSPVALCFLISNF